MTGAHAAEIAAYETFEGARIAYTLHRAEAGVPRIVVMAHGFRSSKIGPSRYFVTLARMLAERGVSTFRFDQPGSGDSDGAFDDSSFETWTRTIEHFARKFVREGARVAILGQSMGGTATLVAASRLERTADAIALWSPALLRAGFDESAVDGAYMEEDGQRVPWQFWREAASHDLIAAYHAIAVPVSAVFGTADAVITVADMREFEAARKAGDTVRVIEGMPHSAWPYARRTEIIAEAASFLSSALA